MNKSRITSSDQKGGEINRKETIQHQRKTKDQKEETSGITRRIEIRDQGLQELVNGQQSDREHSNQTSQAQILLLHRADDPMEREEI